MARRNLDQIKTLIMKHNALLKEYGFSLRQRHKMINNFNHARVSWSAFRRWDHEGDLPTLEERTSKEPLDWNCPECQGHVQFDHENSELTCTSCGLVIERIRANRIELAQQMESYQPALESSFGHGLGTPPSPAILRHVVQQVVRSKTLDQLEQKEKLTHTQKQKLTKERNKLSYKRYGDQIQLRQLTTRLGDGRMNSMLKHLTERMREIEGFDPESDNDNQFGELDKLGRFIRRARAEFKGSNVRFNGKLFVDALLFVVYGKSAQAVLEAPSKRLLCPRCKRKRKSKSQLLGEPFALDRDPQFYLCCSCGLQVLKSQAEFHVSYTPIDPVYIKTIQNLMPEPEPRVTLTSPPELKLETVEAVAQ